MNLNLNNENKNNIDSSQYVDSNNDRDHKSSKDNLDKFSKVTRYVDTNNNSNTNSNNNTNSNCNSNSSSNSNSNNYTNNNGNNNTMNVMNTFGCFPVDTTFCVQGLTQQQRKEETSSPVHEMQQRSEMRQFTQIPNTSLNMAGMGNVNNIGVSNRTSTQSHNHNSLSDPACLCQSCIMTGGNQEGLVFGEYSHCNSNNMGNDNFGASLSLSTSETNSSPLTACTTSTTSRSIGSMGSMPSMTSSSLMSGGSGIGVGRKNCEVFESNTFGCEKKNVFGVVESSNWGNFGDLRVCGDVSFGNKNFSSFNVATMKLQNNVCVNVDNKNNCNSNISVFDPSKNDTNCSSSGNGDINSNNNGKSESEANLANNLNPQRNNCINKSKEKNQKKSKSKNTRRKKDMNKNDSKQIVEDLEAGYDDLVPENTTTYEFLISLVFIGFLYFLKDRNEGRKVNGKVNMGYFVVCFQ